MKTFMVSILCNFKFSSPKFGEVTIFDVVLAQIRKEEFEQNFISINNKTETKIVKT